MLKTKDFLLEFRNNTYLYSPFRDLPCKISFKIIFYM